jgi:hypothetical protein
MYESSSSVGASGLSGMVGFLMDFLESESSFFFAEGTTFKSEVMFLVSCCLRVNGLRVLVCHQQAL